MNLMGAPTANERFRAITRSNMSDLPQWSLHLVMDEELRRKKQPEHRKEERRDFVGQRHGEMCVASEMNATRAWRALDATIRAAKRLCELDARFTMRILHSVTLACMMP